MSATQEKTLTELFEQYGILPTNQRLHIASVLLSTHQHLSAEQVLERVNRSGKKVSKATVYNTLNLFANKGLVLELMVDSNKVFYDSNTAPHHHFYNQDTGMLSDVSASAIEFSRLPDLPADTCSESIDVIIRVRNKTAAGS